MSVFVSLFLLSTPVPLKAPRWAFQGPQTSTTSTSRPLGTKRYGELFSTDGMGQGWEGLSTFGSEACVPLLFKELFVFLVLSLANQLAKVLCICDGQVPAFFCIPDLGVPLASH